MRHWEYEVGELGVDVVNPCFTPAAQYGRVTVQPVANLIYIRCSSFLHHWPFLTWTSSDAACRCGQSTSFT